MSTDTAPRGPVTYVISYGQGNTTSKEWCDRMAQAPPDLLHHGHDVPLNNLWGPTQPFSAWEPDHSATYADVLDRIAPLQKGVDALHSAGVRWVIPYINPSIIGGRDVPPAGGRGDPPKGFFHFWRRRNEFTSSGFPELPDADPMNWMQRNWFSFAPYNEKTEMRRYEPCLRQEPWLRYLEHVVELVGRSGFDGVFSDDNLVQCYCPQCMKDFRCFLESEYPERLAELTKETPLQQIMLYSDDGEGMGPAMRRPTTGELSEGPAYEGEWPEKRWQQLLWAASQAFWAQTIGDALARIRDAGRKHNPSFFVVANWGSSQTTGEFSIRRRLGHDFRRWRTGADWQMLEEEGDLGYVAPGLAVEYWPACRAALAHDVEPALLAYHRQEPEQVSLGFAEVTSACGGAYVDNGGHGEQLNAFRRFHERRKDLLTGLVPYAQVGLVYSLDELAINNDRHLRLFYAAARALGRSHIPFDVVTPENATRYRLIVNPAVDTARFPGVEGCQVINVGPSERAAAELLSRQEIELDDALSTPRSNRDDVLAKWSDIDLAHPAGLVRQVTAILGDISLTDPREAPDVRLRAYRTMDTRRIVIHVVNYGCTSASARISAPGAARQFRLHLPVLEDAAPHFVWTEGPEEPEMRLEISGDRAMVIVPSTEVYRIIVVDY